MNLKITSTLNQGYEDESWGIANLKIEYFNDCPEDCKRCYLYKSEYTCQECEEGVSDCDQVEPVIVENEESGYEGWTYGSTAIKTTTVDDTLMLYRDANVSAGYMSKTWSITESYYSFLVEFTALFDNEWSGDWMTAKL